MDTDPRVILFAIIALEKFAQTSENKLVINDRLNGVGDPTSDDSLVTVNCGSGCAGSSTSSHRKHSVTTRSCGKSLCGCNSAAATTASNGNTKTNGSNRRKVMASHDSDEEVNSKKKKLKIDSSHLNPLLRLEKWMNGDCGYVQRQVGFCAQWCLDNLCQYNIILLLYLLLVKIT